MKNTCISKFVLVALLLGLTILSGSSYAEDQSTLVNKIESMDFSSLPGGRVLIRVKTTKALANPPADFAIINPVYIVLDFPKVANGLSKNNITADQRVLKSVTLAQAKKRTPLVLNLSKNVAYDTTIKGN
jgi:type IV pilus assembly protein PilQ